MQELVLPESMQLAVARGGDFGHKRPLPRVQLDDFHAAEHLVLHLDAGVLDVHDPLLPGAGLDGNFRRERNGENLTIKGCEMRSSFFKHYDKHN